MSRKNELTLELNDGLILEMIKKYGSVMPLIKSGFSYLDVFLHVWKLERDGKVRKEEGDYRILTEEGEKTLHELEEKRHNTHAMRILPLHKFKMQKIKVDDIFLP